MPVQKAQTTSEDMANENLLKLKEIFPQFVKDGDIDFDALRRFFKDENLLAGEEKYGLGWAGKNAAFKAIRMPSVGTLAPDREVSKNWDATENLFIEGDNLEVLKLLQKHYREKVKMIYIDPPYNTGKDFIYKDNFTESASDYYERTGQSENGIKLTSNPESNGRYHSDWLTMMYPRLFLARNLLREDGVIFISIDDNEVANLRLIMDEIFGEENFIANILWKKKTNPNNIGEIPPVHDYILVYKKSEVIINGFLMDEAYIKKHYKNPDNDKRGPWKTMDLSANHVGPYFEITNPETGRGYFPPEGRFWVFNENEVKKRISEGRIIFGTKGESGPVQKKFLSEADLNVYPDTWWDDSAYNSNGTEEVGELIGKKFFTHPKPVDLLKRLIQVSTDDNSLLVDFFAGSGTTAHAVMDLNAEDGGNRKWICVQLPEMTEEGSEAFKAGYKTIADISRERVRRAGEMIGKGDIGFKSLVLKHSNYRQWNAISAAEGEEAFKKQTELFIESPLVDGYDEEFVVYEIALKEGFDLNAKAQKTKLGDLNVWVVESESKKLVISFAKKLSIEEIESLKLSSDDTFVCFDSALDDTTKVNVGKGLVFKII